MTTMVRDDHCEAAEAAAAPEVPEAVMADVLEIGITPAMSGLPVRACVSGEIDFHNAAALREILLIALTSHRCTLLVDMRSVTFCDCAGLNALLTARLAALRAGRSLRVTAASRPVERLFRLTATRSLLT
ncbi:STAS domain-containing protein [Streptomyces sp. NPDC006512]|uniref:STAS domain-containing protein n=1 Tax=Streptomyces sp. NPDC006512 TaxID=3154307 RepID=UPI0033A47F28